MASEFLTASRTGRARLAEGKGLWRRAVDWSGWPACLSGARTAAAGYLVLTVVLIGAGLLVSHALTHSIGRWDEHVNALFVGQRTHTDDLITGAFTVLANAPGIIGVAVIVSAMAAVSHRTRLALLLVVGLAVEMACFLTVNYTVERPRPHVKHLGTTPSTYSWPSGHVGATLVVYGGIALMVTLTTRRVLPRILSWTVAVAVTACVGLSRVYRGEHHPTDAVAGLVLGVGALITATLAVRARAGRMPVREGSSRDTDRHGAVDEIADVA